MGNWFSRTFGVKHKAVDLYGKVVTAARAADFYGPGRVPDTPEGRFELVAMHLFLLVERIASVKPEGEELGRHLIETFVTDMDDCMREMGVGDLTVPKRVKRAAATFYERSGTYRGALAAKPVSGGARDPLEAAVARDLLHAERSSDFSTAVAAYMRASQAALAAQSFDVIANGAAPFAQPPK